MSLKETGKNKQRPSAAKRLAGERDARIVELLQEDKDDLGNPYTYKDISKELKDEGFKGVSVERLKRIAPKLAKAEGITIRKGAPTKDGKRKKVKLEDIWDEIDESRKEGTMQWNRAGHPTLSYEKGMAEYWKFLSEASEDYRDLRILEKRGYDKIEPESIVAVKDMLKYEGIKTEGLSEKELRKIYKPVWEKNLAKALKEEYKWQKRLEDFSSVTKAKAEILKEHPLNIEVEQRIAKRAKIHKIIEEAGKSKELSDMSAEWRALGAKAQEHRRRKEFRSAGKVQKEADVIKEKYIAILEDIGVQKKQETRVSAGKYLTATDRDLKRITLTGKADPKLTEDFISENLEGFHRQAIGGFTRPAIPAGKYWVIEYAKKAKKDARGHFHPVAVIARVDKNNRPMEIYAIEPHNYLRRMAFDKFVPLDGITVTTLYRGKPTGQRVTGGYIWNKGDDKLYFSFDLKIDGKKYAYMNVKQDYE